MSQVAVDIGGANLKAAQLKDGALSARVMPFALWREPEQLTQRLAELFAPWGGFDELAVTMTAELCDCYETKRQGVTHILNAAAQAAGGAKVKVWLTTGRFASIKQANAQPMQAAASNWHALATYVAGLFPEGAALLFDIGSTTSDIIPLCDGRVMARGLTDTDRLANGELLYVGLKRTPLMALGPTVMFEGRACPIMAEFFATTADVSVLLGRLPQDGTCRDTADGRPLTRQCCAARVLRMIGGDLDTFSEGQATALAAAFDAAARQRLGCAVRQAMAEHAAPERVVISGSGASLASAVIDDAFAGSNVQCVHLRDCVGEAAAVAACATALLYL